MNALQKNSSLSGLQFIILSGNFEESWQFVENQSVRLTGEREKFHIWMGAGGGKT